MGGGGGGAEVGVKGAVWGHAKQGQEGDKQTSVLEWLTEPTELTGRF